VEDDDSVRAFARRVLVSHGYQVIDARDCRSAREQAAADPDLALLLTDQMLPDGLGSDLAAALQRERPGLRTLLMSGYAASELAAVTDSPPLNKPFSRDALLERVRTVLDQAGRQPVR
jgi:DNA-binding NtrC family response regulator